MRSALVCVPKSACRLLCSCPLTAWGSVRAHRPQLCSAPACYRLTLACCAALPHPAGAVPPAGVAGRGRGAEQDDRGRQAGAAAGGSCCVQARVCNRQPGATLGAHAPASVQCGAPCLDVAPYKEGGKRRWAWATRSTCLQSCAVHADLRRSRDTRRASCCRGRPGAPGVRPACMGTPVGLQRPANACVAPPRGHMQDMYTNWMFFRVTLDMLEMVFAKADPRVVKM